MYDEFGFDESLSAARTPAERPERSRPPVRTAFPEAGSHYMGGESDGWEYRTVFAGSNLAYTYDMVKQFLAEEGYADVPIPADAAELRLFKRPRRRQLQLFEENGYVHNPLKILFPAGPSARHTLILCLYNEQAPGHLLRFHGVWQAP
ncbi:MAG: hypothetical protein SFV52_00645 [Saprospiraceae bacterium]|nr:hypothetical protein [Saprospiraceae bacterium]